ncbi:hypothetical protein RB195_024361 [Necator americanus]|uniref:Phlebovirus glycoprotein G2 fusion domain-containing protein n=1 Tax=Necator americanus TaxID=51031 RepID=A0ABR1EMY9_NECAM
MVDQVVKCEIDGNGVPPTSSAVRLANSNVAFGQMDLLDWKVDGGRFLLTSGILSDPIVNCACPSGSGDQRTIHMFSRTMKCETTIPSICTYEARASEATIKNLLILSLKSIVKDIECDIIRLFGTIKSHIIMSSQSLD